MYDRCFWPRWWLRRHGVEGNRVESMFGQVGSKHCRNCGPEVPPSRSEWVPGSVFKRGFGQLLAVDTVANSLARSHPQCLEDTVP